MPELPEVETVCRGLDPVLRGQGIRQVELRREGLRKPFPPHLKKTLENSVISHVARRAKYILVHLKNGKVLIIHLGMSGRVLVEGKDYQPKTHDHLILHLKNDRVIVLNDPRRFGIVLLLDGDKMNDDPAFQNLGPEPLSNQFSGPALSARLKGKKVAIKTALMDQRVVVGVGNIYAAEALFLAGISPKRSAHLVTGERAEKLAAAIRSVLEKAIAAGGSTLRDHRRVDGELGYFQHHFAVYGRAGKACPGCTCDIMKTKGIRRIVQGGRSTFYCPVKQK
ncbi:MAG: bifunctional DNA-formamidopyrimidine glycosylase/DNA-(apurinic or apyrimidinic site) lyase [Micavibrio sp.]